MKVPKIFVPENNEKLEKKTKDYLNRVKYVQKPYDEEELGIGATVYVMPKMCLNSKEKKAAEEEFRKKISSYTVVIDPKDIVSCHALGIGAADTPPKFLGLSVEELEKKLLEDYTVVQ